MKYLKKYESYGVDEPTLDYEQMVNDMESGTVLEPEFETEGENIDTQNDESVLKLYKELNKWLTDAQIVKLLDNYEMGKEGEFIDKRLMYYGVKYKDFETVKSKLAELKGKY